MSNPLTVSIIVPTYNAADTLPACLSALQQQVVDPELVPFWEIIVVDDGSTDATTQIVEQFDGVRLITHETNLGRSDARNNGALAAEGEILLFTDADCRPTPDWLMKMLAGFNDPAVIGVKGAYLCDQKELIPRFTQLELEDKYDELARHRYISFIDTYSAGYRRDTFFAVDGFDQSLAWRSGEDQDLSFRLAADGQKMVFAPEARVYHQHLVGIGRYYWRKWDVGYWKSVLLKRYPERLRNDSRTPLTLKAQFGLAILLTLALPLAIVWRPIRTTILPLLLLAFGITTIPFHRRAWQRDRGIFPFVLPFLLVRAFGLAHGYINGTLAHKDDQPSDTKLAP